MSEHGPQLGIWWLVGDRLVAFTMPFNEAEESHQMRDASQLEHWRVWEDQMIQRYPNLKGMDYYEIPRGRVTWRRGVFQLLMSTDLSRDEAFVSKLVERFNLSRQTCRVLTDDHYEIDAS